MIRIERCPPLRRKSPPGQMCKGYRMKHRPRSGRPEPFERLSPDTGENPQRIHVGMLSLARSHANRGEALQKLAVVEPFLTGVLQIPQLEIFVKVDKFLAVRMGKDGIRVCRAFASRGCQAMPMATQPEPAGGLCAGLTPVCNSVSQ